MTLKDSPSSPANHHKSAKHAPRANPHCVPAQQSMRPQPFVHSKQQHEQTEKACGRVGGSQNMPKNRCCFFSVSSISLWSTGGLGILLCCYRVHYQQTPAFKRARAILNDCCKDSPACNNSSCDRQFRTQTESKNSFPMRLQSLPTFAIIFKSIMSPNGPGWKITKIV